MIGVMGALDSRPGTKGRPTITRSGAIYQQASGTRANPFAHAAPCNLLFNGLPFDSLFASAKARTMVERLFGMGVMAPDDWASNGNFELAPAQQNITDNIAESFSSSGGLAAAFQKTIDVAGRAGKWDSSGRHQHNASSLTDFVIEQYRKSWYPEALEAYETARSYLSGRLLAVKRSADEQPAAILEHRIDLIDSQIAVLTSNSVNLAEAARNVISATDAEKWK